MSVQRTDDPTTAGAVNLTLDYSQFVDAFGGDWASRLHLVTLPACALTTPTLPTCRTQTPLTSTNNAQTKTVSADVMMAPAAGTTTSRPGAVAATRAAEIVVAATAAPAGGGGDFTATSLKPSGSWQAGGSSDSFSWSYPITVPPVPGGLEPQVQLSYDSQSVDGLTSSTNNQASWIGDGWDYSPGYVERSYQSCQQNPAGVTKTSDNCWTNNNTLTLSLNGQTTTLVKDDATGTYRPQDDSNERVQYKTGAINGSQGGEYFIVTTDDGTQYYFGLNELPGYSTGNTQTNSVWTEPIYSTQSFPAEPSGCWNATFSQSNCMLAYRWNLDYVVDTHLDAVSYFYKTETNYYTPQDPAPKEITTPYIRAGYLSKIQYGQRAGQVYSTTALPAGEVEFDSVGRCQTSCAESSETSATASQWPDVPFDLNCGSGATCANQSPSFWSENTLQTIKTFALVGTTETPVDTWTLAHILPAVADAANTKPSLWLQSILHTGNDTTAGGSTAATSLPLVTFTGTAENNRVNLGDGFPWITRQRLTDIKTETGEHVTVNYVDVPSSSLGCTATTEPANPSLNGTLCFPDYWTPVGQTAPRLDWFNKYIVSTVTEEDPTGGANDNIETTYTPSGTPAWHYNDDPLTPTTPTDQRTWDQWRGFSGMTVSTGSEQDPTTDTHYTYFRGMDGDTLPGNGTRHATVQDVHGDPPATDSEQFTGDTYETVVYNGTETPANIVTETVSDPWTSPATASQALPGGLPTAHAFLTDTTDTRVYTPLSDGTTRATEVEYAHDSEGRVTQVNDQGDVSTPNDDLCTTTTYADNTTAWILDAPSEVASVSVKCSTAPSYPADAVSDQVNFYDGATSSATAPTIGDVTQTQQAISYSGTTPTMATASTTVDQYGRTLTSTDPDKRKTTTTYTPLTGAEPTSVKVSDPLTHAITTKYDPLRDLPTQVADAAGFVTNEQYDALGRLTAVYKPGNTPGGTTPTPDMKYSYVVSDTGPSVVDTSVRTASTYRLSETLYDSLLRARETQTQAYGGGRDVTDTIYNTDGWQSRTNDPYYNSGDVSATYVQAQVGDVPSATGYSYDSAGRRTSATAYASGNQTWQTTYAYGGNVVTTVPPAGAPATTTVSDARGNTTDLYEYHTGVPADPIHDPASDYSDTHYTYTPANKQATVVDPAGNTWSYHYDLLGNRTSASDPDVGTTSNTYDVAGQLMTATDARGKQTSYKYDTAGRKTATYDTTGNAAETTADQTGAWTYDSVKAGYPTAAISFSGGDTINQHVTAYSPTAQPKTVTTTIVGPDAAMLPTGGYTVNYGFNVVGQVDGEDEPAAGGLPSESVVYGFDSFGRPTSTSGGGGVIDDYVDAVGYDSFDKPLQYTMPATAGNVTLKLAYNPQTQALTDALTNDSNQTTAVDDTSYTYSSPTTSAGAGLVMSTTDKQNGGATTDTQCFTYDYAQRLSAAWTGIDQCAATPTSVNSTTVGGPTPYWQSWTYDAAGDRLTQTDHDTTHTATSDTTTSYTYPAAGSATDQPHTLTSTTATGPQATQNTASYAYDPSGNTTTITGGATGDQTLTWNDQSQLATDTTSAGATTYVYDAGGNVAIRRDPAQKTLFIGDEQIVQGTTTGTLTGTRYYTIGDITIASRSSQAGSTATNAVYLIPDRQGTDQLTIDPDTYAVTRRQYLPFGQTRGTAPAIWPGGDIGYVGGTPDPTTNLENLGAREYDPANGRFLSADPVFEATDPTQMGGYDYAGNDPVTGSDPTGQMLTICVDRCGDYVSPTNPGGNPRPPGGGAGHPGGGSSGGSSGGHSGGTNKPRPTPPVRKAASPHSAAATSAPRCSYAMGLGSATCGSDPAPATPTQPASDCTNYGYDAAQACQTAADTDPMSSGDVWLTLLNVAAFATSFIPVLGEIDDASVLALDADVAGTEIADAGSDAGAAAKGETPKEPSPACHSFAGATQVLMADGTSKPINTVKVGDQVADAVPDAPPGTKDQTHTVTAVHITYTDHDYTDVTINTPHGPATITGTANHPYWDTTTDQWTQADRLRIDDRLQGTDGGSVTVTTVRDYTARMVTYDLTIDSLHTYYVLAENTPILVHNDDGDDYNQAINKALAWLEQRGFNAERPTIGKFETIRGKPIGMQSADGKTGFRIEFDERNGAHINVWSGKEKGPHFNFDATEATVTKIQGRFGCG